MTKPRLAALLLALAVTAPIAMGATMASASTSNAHAAAPKAVALSVGGQSQVVSPDSLSQCGAHSLCLWDYRDFGSTFWQFTLNNPYSYNTWYYVGDSANNKATSLYNNREYCAKVSRYYPPDNEVIEIPGGTALNYLGNFTWPHSNNVSVNNSITGFELLSGC